MFPERRLLHVKLNTFNRIVAEETCEKIVAKLDWISQLMVTQYAEIRRVDAYRLGHFVPSCEYSV